MQAKGAASPKALRWDCTWLVSEAARRWGERWEMPRGVRQVRECLAGLREKFSFYW